MKLILKFLISVFLLLVALIIYLSTIGIETTKFNKQIGSKIKGLHNDLEIELKEVKIILDPFNLELNAKTVGPKLKLKDKIIEIESIKTKIILDSLLNENFSLKNLDISTRSLEIKNFISFARNIKNTPELYLFEKVLNKGHVIFDIKLEFDKQGVVKNNYKIKGLVKNAQLKLLKKYNLDKINLRFNFADKIFELKDFKLSLNDTFLSSEKILIKNIDNKFLVEGTIQNKNLKLKDKFSAELIKNLLPKLNLINIDLNSKNKFSFIVNKKYKIEDFKLSSEIDIINLKFINNLELKSFIPNIKEEINLINHIIRVDYNENTLSVNGKGNLLLQDKEDSITYSLVKNKDTLDLKTNLIIDKNPIVIDFLKYEKTPNFKSNIDLNMSHILNGKTVIKSFLYNENNNKIEINNLILNKNFKIKSFKNIILEYFDKDLRENNIKVLIDKNNSYKISGSKFNANGLIENLTSNDTNGFEIFDQKLNFNINIDQVYLDKEHVIKEFKGMLNLEKNEISNAKLKAFFSKNKIFKFTVNTNESEKVTTIFLDNAEPLVKRYKFIKGYKGGSLDFYSSKKGEKSLSNLKIYDFRLKELPILTKLLTLASLQGIADILSGEGITFDEFEMNFENQNNLMTISEMYAIGPAISILMDGYIEKNKLISLRGSLVPATTINKAIGNIPVLGKILVGSKTGEGVFGVSFKIKGPPGKLETSVNPIKTLTPRFITRTLEKIKKN